MGWRLSNSSWTETSAAVPDTASISISSLLSSSPADTDGAAQSALGVLTQDQDDMEVLGAPVSPQSENTKASIYLDAVESPSVAEILKELREIPDPPQTSQPPPAEEAEQVTTQTEHQAAVNQAALEREEAVEEGLALPPQAVHAAARKSRRATKRRPSKVDAVVNMREDSAGAFQVRHSISTANPRTFSSGHTRI